MNVNQVFLGGRLTRDPEMRHLPSGAAVTQLGVATNRVYNDKEGNKKEDVLFCDCDFFGPQAETIHKYFRKGSRIFIQGHLRLDQWETKDGAKRSKLKVVGERFEFVDKKSEQANPAQTQPVDDAKPVENNVDDLPF